MSIEVPAIEILQTLAPFSPLRPDEIDDSYQSSLSLPTEISWFRPPSSYDLAEVAQSLAARVTSDGMGRGGAGTGTSSSGGSSGFRGSDRSRGTPQWRGFGGRGNRGGRQGAGFRGGGSGRRGRGSRDVRSWMQPREPAAAGESSFYSSSTAPTYPRAATQAASAEPAEQGERMDVEEDVTVASQHYPLAARGDDTDAGASDQSQRQLTESVESASTEHTGQPPQ